MLTVKELARQIAQDHWALPDVAFEAMWATLPDLPPAADGGLHATLDDPSLAATGGQAGDVTYTMQVLRCVERTLPGNTTTEEIIKHTFAINPAVFGMGIDEIVDIITRHAANHSTATKHLEHFSR